MKYCNFSRLWKVSVIINYPHHCHDRIAMYCRPAPWAVTLSLTILLSTVLPAALANEVEAGPLDSPLIISGGDEVLIPVTTLPPAVDAQDNPIESQEQLQLVVEEEQEALEQLPRDELIVKAEQGERAAQVALGADFAREASLLSFAPAAANDALADAVHWYSEAAANGFPGAPSLDEAGIRFVPIRVQRDPLP